ncbi:MAG: DEAD/DEAH box helicase [Kiritimatiellia bacterium]
MAFGFLKKLIAAVTGRKPAAAGSKRGASNRDGARKGEGRHRHGHSGAKPQGDSPRREPGARSGERGRGARDGRGGGQDPRGTQGPRRERGGRDRRREGGRRDRGPRSVNTAANEMRPGGVITPAEMEKRRAEHAAWNPESFAVEAVEGKMRFHDFDLPAEVMHGIADLGFQYCTEIQALSLQNALDGKNIAGKAQTGSGKTAAFLVAILTRYLRTPDQRAKAGGCPRALVIAPTRELVIQICKDAAALGKYTGLRALAVYGGMDLERQAREILDAPVDLLVATPGRLLDFCKRPARSLFTAGLPAGVAPNSRVLDLRNVDTLVVDEADRMLDMGFIPDVREIMRRLPPKEKRTTMLYSATLTDDVMRLASQWMEEPVRAEVESSRNATDTVRQVVYIVRAQDKFKVLFNHIALHPDDRAIVFCNMKVTTEDVYESLRRRGVACEMLSGDVNQSRRLRVLEDFRAGKIKIVVATDVAGRGIHVDDIEYVINFDFPFEAEDYVHRIGRTGRAGNTGIAISFADEDESFAIPEIEAYIKEPLKCTMIHDDDPLLKPLDVLARGQTAELKPVDEAAKATVDAREAVTEEQKAAAAALVGAVSAAVSAPAAERA